MKDQKRVCYMFVSILFHVSGFCYFTEFLVNQREKRNAKLFG